MKTVSTLIAFLFAVQVAFSTSITKTHTFASAYTIDGTGDYAVSFNDIEFIAGTDFPASDRISSVNVSIQFHKTDGSCGNPRGGYAYHGETTFRVVSPSGTSVILANDDTWTGGSNSPTVTVEFSALASTRPSGTPTSGTFRPRGGNLNDFVNEFATGVWTLQAGDDAGADPLCIYSYSITVNTFSPLPIELLSFDAQLDNSLNATNLTWATASELNNDFFTIEKSNDLENWEVVTMVEGAGFSVETINYSTKDDNLNSGVSYYRLKQTDYNGDYTYSEIKAVENHKNNVEIATTNQSITIKNITETYNNISLINSFGQVVKQITGQIDSEVTFSNLETGVYFIQIDNLEVKKTMIL